MNFKSIVILPLFFYFTSFSQKKAVSIFKEKYRPNYHLTSVKGALFDPTALVYVNGYYQVNRRLALSKDLVHWKFENRHSIKTDSTREMSGSVVIDSSNTSGFGKNRQPPLVAIYSVLSTTNGKQTQCIAYSNDDGKTWLNYNKNPVIDINSSEFRDPQVFWYMPSSEWIMVVAMAAEQKVRFYNSPDLKDWHYLSDFGPAGAIRGVWECPDLFALPVDGNKDNIKWVLEVDVQPVGGQYYIGHFDGKQFVADSAFMEALQQLKNEQSPAPGRVLFDFENNLSGWQQEGDAFAASPASGVLPYQNAVIGFNGKKLVNSFNKKDAATGKITSPSFNISKKCINFLIGGGDHPGKTCINLLINGKIVRTATGIDTEVLNWAGWDVRDFNGMEARVEIVDAHTGGFGHITVDDIMLSDQLAKTEKEKTMWVDYGPDFYAVRSWVNGPDERRIWVAWLGSWLYASTVPTSPWKGGHTFPREVKLKNFPEGIRLIQQPVQEIKSIRGKKIHFDNLELQPGSSFNKLKPTDNAYELDVELELKTGEKFSVDLCKGINQQMTITYDADSEILFVNRIHSGETDFSASFPGISSAPLKLRNGIIQLRILVDHSSIEVFGNDGETVVTCQIFPDPAKKGIELYSHTGTIKIKWLDFWPLRSVLEN